MLYVFIDESGDLGFTKNSTKYYVIATVEARDLLELSRVAKRVRKTIGKKKKNIPELKFSKSDDVIRRRFFDKLVKENITFSAIVLHKRMVYNYLRNKKEKLHNYLAGLLAESLCYEYSNEREFSLIIDKFIMNTEKRLEFDVYLGHRLSNSYTGVNIPKIEITHEDSKVYPGLQAVDFVAGSVFQYYERGNNEFYEKVKPKLRVELRKWF